LDSATSGLDKSVSFEWNPDAGRVLAETFQRQQAVVAAVSRDYGGHPVEEVREVLRARREATADGVSFTDPELTAVATAISAGKRAWLENDGRLMVDD
jgi:hypothetical protein